MSDGIDFRMQQGSPQKTQEKSLPPPADTMSIHSEVHSIEWCMSSLKTDGCFIMNDSSSVASDLSLGSISTVECSARTDFDEIGSHSLPMNISVDTSSFQHCTETDTFDADCCSCYDLCTEDGSTHLMQVEMMPSRARQYFNDTCQVTQPHYINRAAVNAIISDPFDKLPDELLCIIGSYLTVSSLNNARSLCSRFYRILSRDEAGWMQHCSTLWAQKVCVCNDAWSLLLKQDDHNRAGMEAYRLSCYDGRFRQEISFDELCFDPARSEGVVWYFRFKDAAGPDWTSLDPWHAGLNARRMVFLTDGSVMQLGPADAEIPPEAAAGSTSAQQLYFRLQPAVFDSISLDGIHRRGVNSGGMKWRFVSNPVDFPLRPQGSYIRLSVDGRDIPTYIVRRSPSGNWGFIMENCWGVFASFPLPRKRKISDGTATSVNRQNRLLRSSNDREVKVGSVQTNETSKSLLEDSALSVTHSRQWREALLYNCGVACLPAGENATDDFDELWRDLGRVSRQNRTSVPRF